MPRYVLILKFCADTGYTREAVRAGYSDLVVDSGRLGG